MNAHDESLANPVCWIRLVGGIESLLSHFRSEQRKPKLPLEPGPYERNIIRNHNIDNAFQSIFLQPCGPEAIQTLRLLLDTQMEDDGYNREIWSSSEAYHGAIRRGLLLYGAEHNSTVPSLFAGAVSFMKRYYSPTTADLFADAISLRRRISAALLDLEEELPETITSITAHDKWKVDTFLSLARFNAPPEIIAQFHCLAAQWYRTFGDRIAGQHLTSAQQHLEHVCRFSRVYHSHTPPGLDTETTKARMDLAHGYLQLGEISCTGQLGDRNDNMMDALGFIKHAMMMVLDLNGGTICGKEVLDPETLDFLVRGADRALLAAVKLPRPSSKSDAWLVDLDSVIESMLCILGKAGVRNNDEHAGRKIVFAEAYARNYLPTSDNRIMVAMRQQIEELLQAVISQEGIIGNAYLPAQAYSMLGWLESRHLHVLLYPSEHHRQHASPVAEIRSSLIRTSFERVIGYYEAALNCMRGLNAEHRPSGFLGMLVQALIMKMDYDRRLHGSYDKLTHHRLIRLIKSYDSRYDADADSVGAVLYSCLGMSYAMQNDWDAACREYSRWSDLMDARRKLAEHETTRAERYLLHQKAFSHASLSHVLSSGDVLRAMIVLEKGRGRELRERLLLDEGGIPQPPLTMQGDMQLAMLSDFATIGMNPGDDIDSAIETGWPLLYINPTHFGTSLLGGSRINGGTTWHNEFVPALTASLMAKYARLLHPRDPACKTWFDFSERVLRYSNALAKVLKGPLNRLIELWRKADPNLLGITVVLCGEMVGAPLSVLESRGCLGVPLRYAPSAFAMSRIRRRLSSAKTTPRLLALGIPEKVTGKTHNPEPAVSKRIIGSTTLKTPSRGIFRTYNDNDVPIDVSIGLGGNLLSDNPAVNADQAETSSPWQTRAYSDSLDGVPIECDSVATLFPRHSSKVLHGPDATLGALQKHWHNNSHVLLSCHGDVNLLDRSSSCVYLADGPVTAGDLPTYLARSSTRSTSGSNEVDTRLVFISSCHTAQPNIIAPDEPLSLPISFIIAGSPCVIACQWVLPDLVGTLLSLWFFDLHLKGLDPATALYQSQKWLRGLSKPFGRSLEEMFRRHPPLQHLGLEKFPGKFPFANPVYWAGWVCMGI